MGKDTETRKIKEMSNAHANNAGGVKDKNKSVTSTCSILDGLKTEKEVTGNGN